MVFNLYQPKQLINNKIYNTDISQYQIVYSASNFRINTLQDVYRIFSSQNSLSKDVRPLTIGDIIEVTISMNGVESGFYYIDSDKFINIEI